MPQIPKNIKSSVDIDFTIKTKSQKAISILNSINYKCNKNEPTTISNQKKNGGLDERYTTKNKLKTKIN